MSTSSSIAKCLHKILWRHSLFIKRIEILTEICKKILTNIKPYNHYITVYGQIRTKTSDCKFFINDSLCQFLIHLHKHRYYR